ncbi:hypothetical protein [Deinococcus sp.]|uniref:hypothetical protein n=1 Tax=Deinococcus sp. TaxID=47478 RepID=UPI003CC54800
MSSLPARVRVSRLPLPPAPTVQVQLLRLFPALDAAQMAGAAVALAGGRVVGAALLLGGQTRLEVDAGWRGKGLEAALLEALAPGDPA